MLAKTAEASIAISSNSAKAFEAATVSATHSAVRFTVSPFSSVKAK
jgi:hypothetical protein